MKYLALILLLIAFASAANTNKPANNKKNKNGIQGYWIFDQLYSFLKTNLKYYSFFFQRRYDVPPGKIFRIDYLIKL